MKNIKRFESTNEGVKQYLKPKSMEDVINPFKDTLLNDCNSVSEYINNIKNKYEKEVTDVEKFLEDVVIMEILDQITNNRKKGNYDYDTYYHRRLGYLRANLGLKDLDGERIRFNNENTDRIRNESKNIITFEKFEYNSIDDVYDKSLKDDYWKNISDKFPKYNDSKSNDCKKAVDYIMGEMKKKYKLDLDEKMEKDLRDKIHSGLT